MKNFCLLGIETSCDETGLALLSVKSKTKNSFFCTLHGQKLASQVDLHNLYGGVVPELASREHLKSLFPLTEQLFMESGIAKEELNCIAFTAGPGLNGALLTGASFATGLAASLNLPVLPINHLEGHILSGFFSHNALCTLDLFPFLVLLVSGGHTQLISASGIGRYEVIGETIDDAVGETFDKASQLLGLGYPGGPAIEKLSKFGDDRVFSLPKPLLNDKSLNFSLSGLKTAFMLQTKRISKDVNYNQLKCDLAASLQKTVSEILVAKSRAAIRSTGFKKLIFAGGVAANKNIRRTMLNLQKELEVDIFLPPANLCTDNGLMIAWAAALRLLSGKSSPVVAEKFDVRPRWPINKLQ